MLHTMEFRFGSILALLFWVFFSTGCGGEDPVSEGSEKDSIKETVSPEALEKLPAFDALDGTVDHVVHLCAGCDFSMDGKEENPIEVGDYTLHFCNPHCAKRFKTDTDGKLLSLETPSE